MIDPSEELLGGVLQAAEYFQNGCLVAEPGALESLRWSNSLPLLLRDFNVSKIVDANQVWACLDRKDDLLELLDDTVDIGLEDSDDEYSTASEIEHLVLLVSGFLWDYETHLRTLVQLRIARRISILSCLSEHAHECYPFRGPVVQMCFDHFASMLQDLVPQVTAASTAEDEWGWEEDGNLDQMLHQDATNANTSKMQIHISHLPLHYSTLLSPSTSPLQSAGDSTPSIVILSHPSCSSVYPLMLSHLTEPSKSSAGVHHGREEDLSHLPPAVRYSHVNEVPPDDIPSTFRRSLRLLAHVLADTVTQMRLDVRENIFTMGGTSLKIGHTLLRILNESREESAVYTTPDETKASVILVDRTADLASPNSFGSSLVDKILSLLPQTPSTSNISSTTNRSDLSRTEIYPMHGCRPTPLISLDNNVHPEASKHYASSSFLQSVQYDGGATLHPSRQAAGIELLRSLVFKPPKMALRDVDRKLQYAERELTQAQKVQKKPISRKPGQPKPSTRGRDVVLRRVQTILEAGEPAIYTYSSIMEMALIVLEALERMEGQQSGWDEGRSRVLRHIQLMQKDAKEWIVPDAVDYLQRHVPLQAEEGKDKIRQLLSMLVHAFAVSSGPEIEDYTMEIVGKALVRLFTEIGAKDPELLRGLFPDEAVDSIDACGVRTLSNVPSGRTFSDEEGDEWGWEDPMSPVASPQAAAATSVQRDAVQVEAIVTPIVMQMIKTLKECSQLCAKAESDALALGDSENPTGLLAHICLSVINPMRPHVPDLEHVKVVDASEQLTRAGIDLLKSGFSRFGFDMAGTADRLAGSTNSAKIAETNILFLFVVGGITFEEIRQVRDAVGDNSTVQIVLGGTTITSHEIVLEHLFNRT